MRKAFLFLGNLSKWVAGVTLGLMMLLTTADVIWRHLFKRSIVSAHDITELMMVIVIFLGLNYTACVRGHVRVDLITSKLSEHGQDFLNSITSFLSLGIFGTISWRLGVSAYSSFTRGGTTPTVEIPTGPFIGVASIGCALLCAQLILDCYDSVCRVLRNE